jgi:hypothetical protein
MSFRAFGTYQVDAGASWDATGTNALAGGLVDDGVVVNQGNLSLGGMVSGAGTLAVAGGTVTVEPGAALSVAGWMLTGGDTLLNEALTYAGAFTQGAGAVLTLTPQYTLAVTGPANFGGALTGGGRITVANATVEDLAILGPLTFEDMGAVSQSGSVTVGGSHLRSATLAIDAGATWTIEGGGIAKGASGVSIIDVAGTLSDTSAAASVVAVNIMDTGLIVASVGTLDLSGVLTGTGALSVENGATLKVDNAAGSSLTLTFAGDSGTLALAAPKSFAATIAGFAAGDIIDLVGITAHAAKLGAGDTLVLTQKSRTVATLQLTGDYTGVTFAAQSDGHGGTTIAVSSGAAPPTPSISAPHIFIGAAATMGAHLAGAHATPMIQLSYEIPLLGGPRSQLA